MDDDHDLPVSDFGLDSPSPLQSQFNSLFAEFARSRPHVSPPRSPSARQSHHDRPKAPEQAEQACLDLRSLEYAEDYDSHLMCPICHVPFVDPVVLECDHTFCESCLHEYRQGGQNGQHNQCPTCRAFVLSISRKASRLIVNMCNEVKVNCPNEDCGQVLPRGYIERHATRECPHQRLKCPDARCGKLVKRRNFVPDQCIHSSHIECDCGAVIELGKGDWLRHKDEDCPNTGVKCKQCGQRISARDYLNGVTGHICDKDHFCPGKEYGCTDDVGPEELDHHVRSCPLARMAPHLKKQSQLLQSLQEQLAMVKVRNEVLETGFDKINDIVNDRVLPHIDHTDRSPPPESDIEEIERDHIPSAISHRDLLMPAHLRALTPSPDPLASTVSQTEQHLLALHESLRGTVDTLENDITVMASNIADLDARTSMQLMNETLRIKEELAHTNAALFSTRSQVQWLLNRERIGQQQQAMGMRGRTPSVQPHSTNLEPSARSSVSGNTDHSAQGSSSERQPSPGFVASSPNFRPQMRRPSGGSQERVKL
ncbi:TRAF-like signal transducer [Cladophialophora carrionii]|uniref:TRAF-like signal transducer n=1 Tax=Cladophialophora carrionii TaxID=86049 RepID=A0A1C1C7R8_9EURO|nr:TRAF-like signal transducer [Cladophialophora carrionii]